MNRTEAISKSLEYFHGDALAAGVFVDKYALTTPEGDVLEATPDQMHRRLAKEFARIEKKYSKPLSEEVIYNHLKGFEYIIAQGGPMSGIGNPYQIMTLGNCFVLSPCLDAYSGIFKTDQEQVQIMKRRGGVGHDISNIRPQNAKTSNAAKTTDGIGVFMERFSNSTREVAQKGRRGALMLSISVHHPDIETFINIKRNLKKVTGANLSIRLTDEFMSAVENDADIELRWPVKSKTPSVSKIVRAKHIWNQIVESAHACAEPGLLFWDTIIKNTPSDCYSEFESVGVNPCAELVLSKNDSCRLMLINALSFVKNPYGRSEFDFQKFNNVVDIAQRLMDDLVDLELECIDKIITKIKSDPEPDNVKQIEFNLWQNIRLVCERGRRTGLGLTAVGDALAALDIQYGSQESIEMVEQIYKALAKQAYDTTIELAEQRGPFPAYNYEFEKNHEFLNRVIDNKSGWEKYGRRNIALTTTAPAGSVSVLSQTTSGIEPAFQLVYKRRRKLMSEGDKVDFIDELGDRWQEYEVYHHQFKKWMDITGKIKVEDSPWHKSTANDIDWVASVKLQAAAQRWVCHSISKTCNLPKDATLDTVDKVYREAWKSGCKGFTVYRDGCRSGVLVTEEKPKEEKFVDHHASKRPKELFCEVVSTTVNKEKWTFFISLLDERPYEIMGGLSKYVTIPKRVKGGKIVKLNGLENPVARYDFHYDYERGTEDESVVKDIAAMFENATNAAFTRTISLALRHGTPVQYVVEQLLKGSERDDDLFSFSKAVSRVLKAFIKDGTVASDKKCPSCGNESMVYREGCSSCLVCSHSKCS